MKAGDSYSDQVSDLTHNVPQICHCCTKQPVRASVTACLCTRIILELISSALMILSFSEFSWTGFSFFKL